MNTLELRKKLKDARNAAFCLTCGKVPYSYKECSELKHIILDNNYPNYKNSEVKGAIKVLKYLEGLK